MMVTSIFIGGSLGLAITTGGCEADKRTAAATHPGFTTAGVHAKRPVTAAVATLAKRAVAASMQIGPGVSPGAPSPSYLRARRAVAAVLPFLDADLHPGRRRVEEALADLDAAEAKGDAQGARVAAVRLVRALRRVDHELALHPIPPPGALEGLHRSGDAIALPTSKASLAPWSAATRAADREGALEGMATVVDALDHRVASHPGSRDLRGPTSQLRSEIARLRATSVASPPVEPKPRPGDLRPLRAAIRAYDQALAGLLNASPSAAPGHAPPPATGAAAASERDPTGS
ncbi:MAG: hypothetical protein AAGN82_23865 [Myxococcota bacterium]